MKTTILCTIMVLILLLGCAVVPTEEAIEDEAIEIDMTYIDADMFPPSDEWLIAPLEELPFYAEIPPDWGFDENPPEYILRFGDGSIGGITFTKAPLSQSLSERVSDEAMIMQNDDGDITIYCDGNSCTAKLEGRVELYAFIISDKGFSTQQKSKAWDIVKRLAVD